MSPAYAEAVWPLAEGRAVVLATQQARVSSCCLHPN